jgi:hypothetical protein
MKKIIILTVILFLLTACSEKNEYETSPIMEAFIDVLENNTPFIENSQNEHMLVSDYMKTWHEDFYIVQFAIADMDGDGVPEVIIQSPNHIFRMVFRYWNGEIYGYTFGFRQMLSISHDGTFTASGGISYTYLNRLEFTNGAHEIIILANSDLNQDGEGNYYQIFFIGDEQVPEEEWRALLDAHYEKEAADWLPFSVETFRDDFIAAWNAW